MGLEQLRKSLELKEREQRSTGINTTRNTATVKHGKKPLMERYRRQKINNYLEELKCLVLSALNKEVSLYNKMEKADILDMAVKYIKAVRTTSEASTMNYGQRHEYSTTMVPRYQMRSPSPLRVQSANINYDNLFQSSRSTQKCEMKENCARRLQNEKLSEMNHCTDPTRTFATETRTQDVTQYSQQHFHAPLKVKPFTESLSCQLENCDPTTEVALTAKIWRPW